MSEARELEYMKPQTRLHLHIKIAQLVLWKQKFVRMVVVGDPEWPAFKGN